MDVGNKKGGHRLDSSTNAPSFLTTVLPFTETTSDNNAQCSERWQRRVNRGECEASRSRSGSKRDRVNEKSRRETRMSRQRKEKRNTKTQAGG